MVAGLAEDGSPFERLRKHGEPAAVAAPLQIAARLR